MKKMNFDSLDHFKAPQEWIDKAALVPDISRKKRALTVPYRAVAAAALVLVSVVGIVVFMMFNGKPVTEGDMISSSAHTVIETMHTDSFETETAELLPSYSVGISPTRSSLSGDAPTGSTEQSGLSSSPSEPSVLTAKPTDDVSESSTAEVFPTVKATEPVRPIVPTSAATVSETSQPETIKPTETQAPSEHGVEDMDTLSVIAVFPASLITDGEPIYCIVQKRGYAGGTVNDRFSDDRRAHYMIMKNGNVFAGYDAEVDQSGSDGTVTYDYFFYNSKGEILARGSQTV